MNMERYTDRLLRLLEGTLDKEAEVALRSEINQSQELQDELDRLQEMRDLLQGTMKMSGEAALKPFFTDRVMRQLEPDRLPQNEFDDIAFFLSRVFRPVAVAGFVIAMSLAIYNMNISSGFAAETTTAESILALPPVNTLSVYDLDLYVSEEPTTLSIP